MPENAAAVNSALAASHVALPRGLRAEVPLLVFIRNDLWQSWMTLEKR
jgi:hypothetical protein